MKKGFFIAISVLIVTLLPYTAYANKAVLGENTIDLSKAKGVEILSLNDFNGTPNGTGELKSYKLIFPALDQLIYFGSDGANKSGIVPSNRSYMWVLDANYKITNAPAARKNAAGAIQGRPTKEGTFTIVKQKDGNYMAILPLAGINSMAYMSYPQGGTPALKITTFGTAPVSGNLPVLAYATAANIYEAANKVWEFALKQGVEGITAKMREEKEYPEYFKYLGWCSWEEYKDMISEDLMLKSMDDIYKSKLPIRWVLIDEGPQQYVGDRKNRFKTGLTSFDEDPEKFPNGIGVLNKYRREDGIKWMGIWQHQAGLFRGINPENEMGEEINKELFEYIPSTKSYRAKGDYKSQYKFFEHLFDYSIKSDFDFVKIDFQGPQFLGYVGSANAVTAHTETQHALEDVCRDYDLGLINCFAQDMVCALNNSHSVVTRVSQDYRKGKPTPARVQTYQCYNNKLWMGQVVYGDHDMFHSNDLMCNRLMSVAKALSAAPVYLSDAPEDFVTEVITPLTYSDGLLIRPLAPSIPLPESFFNAPLIQKDMYRVIAPLENGVASIACYNIYDIQDDATVKGKVSVDDYKYASAMMQPYPGEWELPKEGLLLYDFYEAKATEFKSDYEFSLTGLSDKLIHLCPITNGWAVIGATSKYLAPATVTDIKSDSKSLTFVAKEKGEYTFWMKNGKPSSKAGKCTSLGNGLWKINVKGDMQSVVITKK